MNFNMRLGLLGFMAILVVAMWGFAFLTKRFENVAAGAAALDAREFDRMTLLPVGTGGTFENHNRGGPALVVGLGEEAVLFDAGRAVAEGLRAAEMPVHQVHAVFLSSLRPENVVGLDDLWLSGWLALRDVPLVVYGPPGTPELVAGILAGYRRSADLEGAAWKLPEAGGQLDARVLADGERVAFEGFSVTAHVTAEGADPSLAYTIEGPDHSISIAVQGEPERIVAAATGADLWVTGAIFGASLDAAAEADTDRIDVIEAEAKRHLRLEEVGRLANEAGVRGVVLTRLRPPPVFHFQYEGVVQEHFRGPVIVAEDAERIVP